MKTNYAELLHYFKGMDITGLLDDWIEVNTNGEIHRITEVISCNALIELEELSEKIENGTLQYENSY